MEHTQKRVQAPQTAASSRAYNDIIKAKPTEIAKPKPASPIAPQHTVADLKAIQQKKMHQLSEKCELHNQYKVAFCPVTRQVMCNGCLFDYQKEQTHQHTDQGETHMFTALITRDLKHKFDGLYKQYKDGLDDVAEVDSKNVKEILTQQTIEFFAEIRKQVTQVKATVKQKIKGSESLKNLEDLIETNAEYFTDKAGTDFEKEKEVFDGKIKRGRFAYVVKQKEFYTALIDTLGKADTHMKETMDEANHLLSRIVQVNPDSKVHLSQLTGAMVEDNIAFDRNSQQEESVVNSMEMIATEEHNEEMMEVPQAEMSMFSSVSPNTCYYRNLRDLENSQIFGVKSKQVKKLDEADGKWTAIEGIENRYHMRVAVIPGKGDCYMVGGSDDAECQNPKNKVYCISKAGDVRAKKGMSVERGRVGLCVGQLISEASTLFQKTYIFAVGGQGKNGELLSSVEKYSTKADMWQSLPKMNTARISPSCCVLSEHLYVFGGLTKSGMTASIERLHLKRQSARFETIDLVLPVPASDIGILPLLNQSEVLLVGGFGQDHKSLSSKFKFSAVPTSLDHGSQGTIEHCLEDCESAGEMKADFFIQNQMIKTSPDSMSKVVIFGGQYKHEFDNFQCVSSTPL